MTYDSYRPSRGTDDREPRRRRPSDGFTGILTSPRRARPSPPPRSRSFDPGPTMQSNGPSQSANGKANESRPSPTPHGPVPSTGKKTIDPRKYNKSSLTPINVGSDGAAENATQGASKIAASETDRPERSSELTNRESPEQKAVCTEPSIKQFLKQQAKQAVLEHRLEQAQSRLKMAIQDEEDTKAKYPNHRNFYEQTALRRQKFEAEVRDVETLYEAAAAEEEVIVATMCRQHRDFLEGVLQIPTSSARAATADVEITRKLEAMEKRLQAQDDRIKAQELEISRLETGKLSQSQLDLIQHDLQHDLERYDDDVKKKLQLYDDRLIGQHQTLIACEKSISGNRNRLKDVQNSIDDHKNGLNAQKTLLNQLTSKFEQNGPSDATAKLQEQVEDLKAKLANLSTQFVPQNDFTALSQVVHKLKEFESMANTAGDQWNARIQAIESSNGDLISNPKELSVSTKADTNSLGNTIELLVKQITSSIPNTTPLPQQTISSPILQSVVEKLAERLSTGTEELRSQLSTATNNQEQFSRHDIVSVQSQVAKLDTELRTELIDLRQLVTNSNPIERSKIEKVDGRLTDLEHRYEVFYKNAKATFTDHDAKLRANETYRSKLDDRLEAIDAKHIEDQRVINGTLSKHSQTLNEVHETIQGLLSRGVTSHAGAPAEINRHQTQVEEKYNAFTKQIESTMQQKIEFYSKEVEALKPHVLSNSHAIRNLNTRYDNISTQKLYSSIISTMQPLGPLCDQIRDDHVRISTQMRNLETGNAQIQNQMSSLQSRCDQQVNIQKDTQAKLDEFQVRINNLAQQERPNRDSPYSQQMFQEQINDLQTEIHRFDTKLQAQLKSLPESISIAEIQQRLTALEAKLDSLAGSAEVFVDKTPLQELRTDVLRLETRLTYLLSNLKKQVPLLLPPTDSIIKIAQLASNVNDQSIRARLDPVKVRQVWYRGGKVPNSKVTTRFALVQVQTPDAWDLIEKFNKKRWNGRQIEVSLADEYTIGEVLLGSSEDPPDAISGTMAYTTGETAAARLSDVGDTTEVNDQAQLQRYAVSQSIVSTTAPIPLTRPQEPLSSQFDTDVDYLDGWDARTEAKAARPSFSKITGVGGTDSPRPASISTSAQATLKRTANERGDSSSGSSPAPKKNKNHS